jgi:endo-1,4-beta-xylanase
VTGELTFRVLDQDGRALSRGYVETLYFSDLDYEPFRNSALHMSVGDGGITLTPPPEPFQASMVMPVEGFGSVYVYADNEGEGFTGGEKEIDFTLEAAKTRIAKVCRWMNEQASAGFTASPAVEEKLADSKELLEQAQKAEARSEKRSAATFGSLRGSLWAGEEAVLEKAQQDITRNGWREGFLFGCALRDPPVARKDELLAGLLNYVTVMLHWTRFEPCQGCKHWDRADRLVSWLQQNHITAKGHPLLWLSDLGMPDWLRQAAPNYETLKVLARGFAYDLVQHFGDTIHIWDVINEAHDWANIFDYSQEQLVELTDLMCETTREAHPDAVRVVNNIYHWGQYVAADTTMPGKSSRPLMTPYKYLEKCVQANVDFEVIGLELYNPSHDMFEINVLFDRFARFGKPIHVTEIGVPSATVKRELDPQAAERESRVHWRRFTDEWHGPWNEDLQADWIDLFYTLCYSKPYITAVTNWEFDDLKGGLVHHSGLLRSDLTPKHSYRRLKELIRSWSPRKEE